ncbi:MAG TPA: maleylpyruvate isomerase family mycothiol-dependent enzyme [Ilumatobacteraceae bacterium]|nr:maleylpyruvate isomerase family mycothiol-dependent enzyme [Ilumatobacteraceae bacterium]
MNVSDYIGFVASEGELFASAAEQGDLNVEIVPCPGWDMRALVRHLGMIHLWAAANVAFPESDWLDVSELPDLVRYWPELAGDSGKYPDDAELVDWYRTTLANLIEVLTSAPSDVAAFTFLPAPSPLAMWARRQASEIAIHRVDAERARGITSHFDPAFATDMLDELLSGFAPRPRTIDIERPQVVHVHAADTDEHWYVTIGPERSETSRCGDEADLTLTAMAADLYVLLWNRTPVSNVSMTGTTDLIDLWNSNFRVRWS